MFKKKFLTCLYRHFCLKVNTFTWRTHTCGELRRKHIGQEVTLCGWVSFQRFDKFIVIKDSYGSTQVIFGEHDIATSNFALALPVESVIQVKGITRERPKNKINIKMPTGEIEVLAKEIKLLNYSMAKLPFTSRDYEKLLDTTKQKYRYLSLRMTKSQEILRTRSEFVTKIREFLHSHRFVDVETPTLFRRTPGGAKEFIVPTKYPGRCYSLVQSPQQFKQLLMVGGIDRYYQIARCYRNEGTKTDRQPEFTQIDIEASFTTSKDIRDLVEQMLLQTWPISQHKINSPFPVITYEEAMMLYGTDKPDLRYSIKIQDLTNILSNQNIDIFEKQIASGGIISGITLPLGAKHIKKAKLTELKDKAQQFSLPNVIDIPVKDDLKWKSFLAKHLPEDIQNRVNELMQAKPHDLMVLVAGEWKNVYSFLGKIRVECANDLQSYGVDLYRPNEMNFLWVIDFPLFLETENGGLESAHHPFTAPKNEDIDLVYTDPLKAKSLHYDLVLNGQEIAGGSIRIHDSAFQKYILENVLKEDTANLQHLLDALASGCPPHGGIALGLDRIISIMYNCRSISEVIAFPKSLDGKDLMSGAPASMSEEDQRLYHIVPKYPDS